MRRGFLVIALLAVGLAACSSEQVDVGPTVATQPASASPSPTGFAATASAKQLAAAEAALKSYRAYMDAVVAARANPARVPDGLKRNSTDQALADELSALLILQEQGIRFKGSPRLQPEVREVDTYKAQVSLSDCQDNQEWIPVDSTTGDSRAAPDQPTRLWVDVTVREFGARWMVTRVENDRGRTC